MPNYLWWGEFFEHGIIDKQALYHTFINSKYYVSQDSELWLKLYHYDRIESDEIFDELINIAIEKIKNRDQFEHIGIFLHVISLLIFFSKEELISEDISMLIQMAKDYIQHFSITNETRFWQEVLEISNFSSETYFVQYKELAFTSDNDSYFEEIKLTIARKMRSIYNNNYLKKINQILDTNPLNHYPHMNLAELIYRKNDEIEYFLPKEEFLNKIDVKKSTDYFLKISSFQQGHILYSIFNYFQLLYHHNEHKSCIGYEACFICEFLIVVEYRSIEAIQENNRLNNHKIQKNLNKYLTVKTTQALGAFIVYIIDYYISLIRQYKKYIAYSPAIVNKINKLIGIMFFNQKPDSF